MMFSGLFTTKMELATKIQIKEGEEQEVPIIKIPQPDIEKTKQDILVEIGIYTKRKEFAQNEVNKNEKILSNLQEQLSMFPAEKVEPIQLKEITK